MNKLKWKNTGSEFLVIRNDSDCGIEIIVLMRRAGSCDTRVYPGEKRNMGPFTPSRFNNPDGFVCVMFDESDSVDIEIHKQEISFMAVVSRRVKSLWRGI